MLKRMRKKLLAQSTLEYAVLIVLIAAALLASQVYIKRAMQGRLKSSADDLGEQFSLQAGNTHIRVNSSSESEETVSAGVTTSKLTAAEVTERTVNTVYDKDSARNEYWGCSKVGVNCTFATDCCSGHGSCTGAPDSGVCTP
jgi:Flp pilus assembly pilin Flp